MTHATTVALIRDLRRQWRRSDDEYRAHPFAICVGWVRDEDGQEQPCYNVRPGKDTLCNECRRQAARRKRGA